MNCARMAPALCGPGRGRFEKGRKRMRCLASVVLIALCRISAAVPVTAARAQRVIDEWARTKVPRPPALKPGTLAPKEPGLLVMDFTVQTCTPRRRLRCANSVP